MAFTIDDYKNQYKEAKKRGDSVGMQKANDGANAIRASQGVAQEVASKDISAVKQQSIGTKPTTGGSNGSISVPKNPVSTSGNSHQDWINNPNSGYGGMDNYKAMQQNKWDEAVRNSDQGMIDRIIADMERVGYDINLSGGTIPDAGNGQILPPQYTPPQIPNRDYSSELGAIGDMIKGNADSFYQQQKAQLEANLAKQIAELEMAYNKAVEEGELSVNEAKKQFEANKKDLEKQAYIQSEETDAYSQSMGIQHSQQSIGLKQGDNQRMSEMNNANMSERDFRINTLRDRIKSIGKEKDIQKLLANSQHASALVSAQAQSSQMYNQGMSELMQKELFARMQQGHEFDMAGYQNQLQQGNMSLEQSYTQDNMKLQDKFNKENNQINFENNKELKDIDFNNDIFKMAVNQGYTIENMNKEQANKLEYLSESNKLAVENMFTQHGFDMEKLSVSLANELKAIDRRAGHTSAENAKAREFQNAQRIQSISDAVAKKEADYQWQLQKDLLGVNPSSDEYKVITKRNELQRQEETKGAVMNALTQFTIEDVFNNPLLNTDIGTKPKMHPWQGGTDEQWIESGGGFGLGSKKEQAEWETLNKAKTEAQKKKDAYLRSMGINTSTGYGGIR